MKVLHSHTRTHACTHTHTQVEDQYTQETLKADEREAALRQQLSHLEDKLRMANTAGTHRR